jgi:hypothetical protein
MSNEAGDITPRVATGGTGTAAPAGPTDEGVNDDAAEVTDAAECFVSVRGPSRWSATSAESARDGVAFFPPAFSGHTPHAAADALVF